MLQGLHECKVSKQVFLSNGKPIKIFSGNLKRLWDLAVKKSELGDFTFHDLRRCAINNLRLAGNDHFTIMSISGHKTPLYSSVTMSSPRRKSVQSVGDKFDFEVSERCHPSPIKE